MLWATHPLSRDTHTSTQEALNKPVNTATMNMQKVHSTNNESIQHLSLSLYIYYKFTVN